LIEINVSYADGTGDVLANAGEQTPEEAKLSFAKLSGLSPAAAGDKMLELAAERAEKEARAFAALIATGLKPPEARAKARQNGLDPIPDETSVVSLAALWSIDSIRSAWDWRLACRRVR